LTEGDVVVNRPDHKKSPGAGSTLGRFGMQELRVTVVSAVHRSELSSHPAGQQLAPNRLRSCGLENTRKGKECGAIGCIVLRQSGLQRLRPRCRSSCSAFKRQLCQSPRVDSMKHLAVALLSSCVVVLEPSPNKAASSRRARRSSPWSCTQ